MWSSDTPNSTNWSGQVINPTDWSEFNVNSTSWELDNIITGFLLQEDGDYILQENGERIGF
jgi:hypothetical protein